ncbi:hypothetical protein [Mycoplasma elephantis]|uniref:hypothetical protein n=1 Tax=Mycoplasma elephantis TaxID=114882 RepID=UPI00048736BC|nr:hypothetical protein [Mycoplasma elephantis]
MFFNKKNNNKNSQQDQNANLNNNQTWNNFNASQQDNVMQQNTSNHFDQMNNNQNQFNNLNQFNNYQQQAMNNNQNQFNNYAQQPVNNNASPLGYQNGSFQQPQPQPQQINNQYTSQIPYNQTNLALPSILPSQTMTVSTEFNPNNQYPQTYEHHEKKWKKILMLISAAISPVILFGAIIGGLSFKGVYQPVENTFINDEVKTYMIDNSNYNINDLESNNKVVEEIMKEIVRKNSELVPNDYDATYTLLQTNKNNNSARILISLTNKNDQNTFTKECLVTGFKDIINPSLLNVPSARISLIGQIQSLSNSGRLIVKTQLHEFDKLGVDFFEYQDIKELENDIKLNIPYYEDKTKTNILIERQEKNSNSLKITLKISDKDNKKIHENLVFEVTGFGNENKIETIRNGFINIVKEIKDQEIKTKSTAKLSSEINYDKSLSSLEKDINININELLKNNKIDPNKTDVTLLTETNNIKEGYKKVEIKISTIVNPTTNEKIDNKFEILVNGFTTPDNLISNFIEQASNITLTTNDKSKLPKNVKYNTFDELVRNTTDNNIMNLYSELNNRLNNELLITLDSSKADIDNDMSGQKTTHFIIEHKQSNIKKPIKININEFKNEFKETVEIIDTAIELGLLNGGEIINGMYSEIEPSNAANENNISFKLDNKNFYDDKLHTEKHISIKIDSFIPDNEAHTLKVIYHYVLENNNKVIIKQSEQKNKTIKTSNGGTLIKNYLENPDLKSVYYQAGSDIFSDLTFTTMTDSTGTEYKNFKTKDIKPYGQSRMFNNSNYQKVYNVPNNNIDINFAPSWRSNGTIKDFNGNPDNLFIYETSNNNEQYLKNNKLKLDKLGKIEEPKSPKDNEIKSASNIQSYKQLNFLGGNFGVKTEYTIGGALNKEKGNPYIYCPGQTRVAPDTMSTRITLTCKGIKITKNITTGPAVLLFELNNNNEITNVHVAYPLNEESGAKIE